MSCDNEVEITFREITADATGIALLVLACRRLERRLLDHEEDN